MFPPEYLDSILCCDSLEFMRSLPADSVDVIITDPPWPGHSKVGLAGGKTAFSLWRQAALECARLTSRLVVILGCTTDTRFLQVPAKLPFVRVVWLERIPGHYLGPIFYNADVAYVFGHSRLNGTDRVMGGLSKAVVRVDRQPDNPHRCKRHLTHMKFLVKTFSRPGQLVFDPFCGSGQTLLAAKVLGRRWCGVDIEENYCAYARRHIDSYQDFFTTTQSDRDVSSCSLWPGDEGSASSPSAQKN